MKHPKNHLSRSTIKFGDGLLMVLFWWSYFSWNETGTIVPVDGITNTDKYISIINENLEEETVKMNLEEEFIFQQDNDPKYIAKTSMKFFPDSDIKLLEWPAQSPDF